MRAWKSCYPNIELIFMIVLTQLQCVQSASPWVLKSSPYRIFLPASEDLLSVEVDRGLLFLSFRNDLPMPCDLNRVAQACPSRQSRTMFAANDFLCAG